MAEPVTGDDVGAGADAPLPAASDSAPAITVLTIHPEMFSSPFAAGVVGRGLAQGAFSLRTIDPRTFATDRHRSVDDLPFGGGAGMVMKYEPLAAAMAAATEHSPAQGDPATSRVATDAIAEKRTPTVAVARPHRVLMSPSGAPLTQAKVAELSRHRHLVLVCGRYEGIDQRFIEDHIDEELSIGDYVLSGGELAAMVIIDAVARMWPGVVGSQASLAEESFENGLLEYPHYTRPVEIAGKRVPEVLTAGNHAHIAQWRLAQAMARTAHRRPELWRRRPEIAYSSARQRSKALEWERQLGLSVAARTYAALVHYPVYDGQHQVVTTAVTNLDVHDLARSAAVYGLAGVFIVVPVEALRDKVAELAASWDDERRDHRLTALRKVFAVPLVADAIAAIAAQTGSLPRVVATTAHGVFGDRPVLPFNQFLRGAHDEPDRARLLLFGTGWGLVESELPQVEATLPAISGEGTSRHLSVRSAAAVVLDRLFGREPAVLGGPGLTNRP